MNKLRPQHYLNLQTNRKVIKKQLLDCEHDCFALKLCNVTYRIDLLLEPGSRGNSKNCKQAATPGDKKSSQCASAFSTCTLTILHTCIVAACSPNNAHCSAACNTLMCINLPQKIVSLLLFDCCLPQTKVPSVLGNCFLKMEIYLTFFSLNKK